MHDPYTPPKSEPADPKDVEADLSGTPKFLFTAFVVLFLAAVFSLGTAFESITEAATISFYALVSGFFAAILPLNRARYFLPLSILFGIIIGTVAMLIFNVVFRP